MARTPCCEKTGLKKGPWTPEEDQKLVDYINKHGYGNWRTLPNNAGLQRCGKSCRLRWTNYLRPDIKRGRFSLEEEEVIIQLHSILGNKWSTIAARLPGRTDNEIKNYWNTNIRKRLLRMGIDPVTHSPRLDLLDMSSLFNNNSKNFNNYCSSSLSNPQMNLSNLVSQDLLALLTQMQTNVNPLMVPTTTQIQTPIPNIATCSSTPSPCVPFLDETQLINPNFEQYPSNISSFDDQNIVQWQRNNGLVDIDHQQMSFDSSYVLDQNLTYNNYEQQNSMMDLATFSAHATLNSNSNSNSTNVNGSWTDEERDPSYSSDMSKFEVPNNILDVNQFLLAHSN